MQNQMDDGTVTECILNNTGKRKRHGILVELRVTLAGEPKRPGKRSP
jgi:hypothetical protein